MDNSIINKINALLIEEFEIDPETITPEASLKTTLDLDSLDYIDLIALTEANFGCKISQEELTQILTFSDLYRYIDSHTKVKAAV